MHTTEQAKICLYCNKSFPSLRKFNKHLEDVHSLPSLSSSQNSCEHKPNSSAPNGTVGFFFLETKDYFDFLQFMVEVKPVVKEYVKESVNTESRKVQLSASVVVENTLLMKQTKKS